MTKKTKRNRLFDSKIFWLVVSLVSSVIIWFYVTGTQETAIPRSFYGVRVSFTGADMLKDSEGLVVTELSSETVTVHLSGTRSNIGKLDETDISAVIDLSKVTKEGVNKAFPTITLPAELSKSDVVITGTQPDYIEFTVERVVSLPFPVRGTFMGNVAEGYVVEEPVFSPENVVITGPVSVLERVSYVWATIGGDNVNKSKQADVPFVVMDADGVEIDKDGLTFDTDTVSMTLPVNATKEVALTVTLIDGAGAIGENCIVEMEPKTITVSGDTTIVNGLNNISVGTIDLTDFASSFEYTFQIPLDNDIENLTGITEATVRVEIPGLETKKLTLTNIKCVNAPSGYTAQIITKSLEVTIRAAADVLSTIKSDNLRAEADLSDIGTTGDVSVPVKIIVDGPAGAGAVGDYKITVNIKR